MDRGSDNHHKEHPFIHDNKEIWDGDKESLVQVGRVILLVFGQWQINDCNGLCIAKSVCNT